MIFLVGFVGESFLFFVDVDVSCVDFIVVVFLEDIEGFMESVDIGDVSFCFGMRIEGYEI